MQFRIFATRSGRSRYSFIFGFGVPTTISKYGHFELF